MWIAARVMIFSLLLGYPLAYSLSFMQAGEKTFFISLVIIPLWVSYLVRALCWKTILGQRWRSSKHAVGQYVHVTKPSTRFLLYSPFAVVLTLTHIYTPFLSSDLCAPNTFRGTCRGIHDLARPPSEPFWRVIFPLSIPGVLAGATFAFVLSLGDFLPRRCCSEVPRYQYSNVVVSLFGPPTTGLWAPHFVLHAGAGASRCSFSRRTLRRNGGFR